MYIQITDKCNMTCEHCGFNCTGRGKFMSLETFKAALDMSEAYDSHITIGGGEPTLHPEFEHFLILAIAKTNKWNRPFIVINGSNKERALLVLRLSQSEIIDGHMSHDQYHDRDLVDDEVFEGFESLPQGFWGGAGPDGYRDPDTVSANGRGKKIDGADNRCACEGTFVKPDGTIRQCGCARSPKIGHVMQGELDTPAMDRCFKGEEYKEEKLALVG